MSSRIVIILSGLVAFLYACVALVDTKAWSLRALAFFALSSGVVALISLVHANLRQAAEDEARDLEGLDTDPAALFNQETQAKVRERTLKQFEKYFLPTFALTLAFAELVAGAWAWRAIATSKMVATPERALMVAAVLLVGAVGFYLLGSFVAGLAFRAGQSVLRAVAGETVQLGWISALAGVVHLLRLTELPSFELLLARVLVGFLIVRAVEKGLTVLLDIYRPRAAGKRDERLLHESRIAGLFAEPKGVTRNLLETINYQFGFEISDTWFFQLLGRLVPLFVLSQILILGGFSCLVFINVGEQAVLERMGRPHATHPVLNPGMHVKLPWPIDKVYRQRVDRVQTIEIGFNTPEEESEREAEAIARLWTGSAAAAGDLFVAANVNPNAEVTNAGISLNLLAAKAVVQYRITDIQLFTYASGDANGLLTLMARRTITRHFASHDMTQLLGGDREALNAELQASLQRDVDARELGLQVLYVGVENLQPPADVAPVFQDVIAAGENREEAILAAQSVAIREAATAESEGERVRSVARAYAYGLTVKTQAEADRFAALSEQYHLYPKLFTERMYLDTLEASLKGRRKIIVVADNADQVITIDMKSKPSTDLLNLNMDQP